MVSWSGLGITAGQPYQGWSAYLSTWSDIVNPIFVEKLYDKFRRVRIVSAMVDTGTYPNNSMLSARLWASALKAAHPDMYILYGGAIGGAPGFSPRTWTKYLEYLQLEAQWAQDNGMDEFQCGNETETSNNRGSLTIATLSRSSNVATATFASDHNLTTGDYIAISGATPSSFNVADSPSSMSSVQCTVVNSTTITYPSTGTDGSASGTMLLYWGYREIVERNKMAASTCRSIFTRGPLIYSCSQDYEDCWITLEKGSDIDLLAFNLYGTNYTSWKTLVDKCFAAFGSSMIVTEVNINAAWNTGSVNGVTPYSKQFNRWWENEIVNRVNYLQSLGISQAYLFVAWSGDNQFAFFYNNAVSNGASGTLGLFDGDWKPVINLLEGKEKETVLLGTADSQ